MNVANLKVNGISNEQCVEKIETNVGNINGVERTLVDVNASEVVVEYHSENVNVEYIYSTIEALGYEVVKSEVQS